MPVHETKGKQLKVENIMNREIKAIRIEDVVLESWDEFSKIGGKELWRMQVVQVHVEEILRFFFSKWEDCQTPYLFH